MASNRLDPALVEPDSAVFGARAVEYMVMLASVSVEGDARDSMLARYMEKLEEANHV